ncbi:MAG: hypothetical protein IJT41_05325 [Clostridia bacterium]|nr:hypothetical protein [Butyrivibrio sp.]MBQ7546369.1 hypothetical protein [Clostridia bacterium]
MKKVNKALALLLSIAVLLGTTLWMTSAEDPVPAHEHTYEAVRHEATCTERAYIETKCTYPGCGSVKEIIPLSESGLGHAFPAEGTPTKAATCTEDGVMTFSCTREGCKETKTEPIKALGHEFAKDGETTKAATCTEDGVMTFSCTREGCKETKTEPIKALGHDFAQEGVVTKEATCTEAGVMSFPCTREGCKEARTEAIPANGHTFGKWQKSEGENADGHKRICSVCKEEDTAPHYYDVTVLDPPTCTESGKTQYTCTVCNYSFYEDVPALGHSFRNWETEQARTFFRDETQTHTCWRCGFNESQTIEGSNLANQIGLWLGGAGAFLAHALFEPIRLIISLFTNV